MRRGHEKTPDEMGRFERRTLDRFERTQRWLDERLGTTSFARVALRIGRRRGGTLEPGSRPASAATGRSPRPCCMSSTTA
jgi:hypothetical protein